MTPRLFVTLLALLFGVAGSLVASTPAAAEPAAPPPPRVQTAESAACAYCLIIRHYSESPRPSMLVAQDGPNNCDSSTTPKANLARGASTNNSPINWSDAGCIYVPVGWDAGVQCLCGGGITWVNADGWKRLAEPTERGTITKEVRWRTG